MPKKCDQQNTEINDKFPLSNRHFPIVSWLYLVFPRGGDDDSIQATVEQALTHLYLWLP